MSDHWFKFYEGDYLRDTSRLSTLAHGAYILLLLDYYSTHRPLPNDDQVLARIAKLSPGDWQAIRPELEGLFVVDKLLWRQKRVERELAKRDASHQALSDAGKRGNAKRWPKKTPIARRSPGDSPPDSQGDRTGDRNTRTRVINPPLPLPAREGRVRKRTTSKPNPPSGQRAFTGRDWWLTHEGVEAKGRSLGLGANKGESWEAYKGRVLERSGRIAGGRTPEQRQKVVGHLAEVKAALGQAGNGQRRAKKPP